ncbi:MAG: transcriptional regulator, TetR family protein [Rhodospirillales bacterium]|nr:transcriptional regulator, TetR family protein [Rhodospirillales bacterium]
MAETKESSVNDADIIAAAAIRLAGERGWRNLPMADIAVEAGIEPGTLMRYYLCRPEILDGFERMIDRRMLAGAAAGDIDDKPRDRLFDIIMERLDALLPYRDGVRRITRELPFDPASAMVLAASLPRSVARMFAGARISIVGPAMPLKLAVLSGVYLATFRVWLSDESQDLGKTMAALDRQLDRSMSLICGTFGRSKPSEPVHSDGPPDVVEPEPVSSRRAPSDQPKNARAPRATRTRKKPATAK